MDSTSTPAATDVDEKTLMIVSVDAAPVCLIRQISSAQTMPNTSIASKSLDTPSRMPSPMPVSALCPRASEKNAICWLTAIVPSSPSSGVSSRIARSALTMKSNCKNSKGSSVCTNARIASITPGLLSSRRPPRRRHGRFPPQAFPPCAPSSVPRHAAAGH